MTVVTEEMFWIHNAEHKLGSNIYTFSYLHAWRSIQQSSLRIAIRSVQMIPATRMLRVYGLNLVTRDGKGLAVTMAMPLGIGLNSTDTMFDANIKFRENVTINYVLHTHIVEHSYFNEVDFAAVYNDSGELVIGRNTTNDVWLELDEDTSVFNAGFRAIVGIDDDEFYKDLCKLTHKNISQDDFNEKYAGYPFAYESNASGYVTVLRFTGVWDRSRLRVCTSFVDQSSDCCLGFTNMVFNPPKVYPVVFSDLKFHVMLFTDGTGQPVELPYDNKDVLVIEAMLMSS